MADKIALCIAKKGDSSAQHALGRSPYYASLGSVEPLTYHDIIQWSMNFSPEQIAGPLRAALIHCGDIRKILNVARKLKSDRNSLEIPQTETNEPYVKLEIETIFAKLISPVAHQSGKRLQCMGINEAIEELCDVKKIGEIEDYCRRFSGPLFLSALC